MTTTPAVDWERRGNAAWIRFNRPERMNALRGHDFAAAAELVRTASEDSAVRVIVLTGTGGAFCAGADLGQDLSPDAGAEIIVGANCLVNAIWEAPQPVVARARGAVAGAGVSLALAADLAFTDSESYFLLSFSRIGLIPDAGATALVAANVGRAVALRAALLAERIPGHDAEKYGLVAGCWPTDEYDDRFQKVVELLASGPTAALAQTKRAVNDAAVAGLSAQLEREKHTQTELLGSTDFLEGVRAFQEKRSPVFVGH